MCIMLVYIVPTDNRASYNAKQSMVSMKTNFVSHSKHMEPKH